MSPVLIACFVLPVTSGATKALYRSLIEMSLWKPIWCVNAVLLWSAALSDINKPKAELSFLTVVCYCLVLAGSLLLTPFLVHALAQSGISQLTRTFGTVGFGAAALGASRVTRAATQIGQVAARPIGSRIYNSTIDVGVTATRKLTPKLSNSLNRLPRVNLNSARPLFKKPEKK